MCISVADFFKSEINRNNRIKKTILCLYYVNTKFLIFCIFMNCPTVFEDAVFDVLAWFELKNRFMHKAW